jgi:hypothetical protein
MEFYKYDTKNKVLVGNPLNNGDIVAGKGSGAVKIKWDFENYPYIISGAQITMDADDISNNNVTIGSNWNHNF